MSMSTVTAVNASALSNGKRGSCFSSRLIVFNLFQFIYHLHFVATIAAEDEELGPNGKKLRPGISSSIITELTDCNAALSQQRKKRQVLFTMM